MIKKFILKILLFPCQSIWNRLLFWYHRLCLNDRIFSILIYDISCSFQSLEADCFNGLSILQNAENLVYPLLSTKLKIKKESTSFIFLMKLSTLNHLRLEPTDSSWHEYRHSNMKDVLWVWPWVELETSAQKYWSPLQIR